MTSQQEVIFSLNIPADDYLFYYQGKVKYILTSGLDGRKIKFPAGALRQFLTHDGVSGRFRLRFDEKHKLISIEKIGELP